jgi:DNA-binding transcriptional LysR family regulator
LVTALGLAVYEVPLRLPPLEVGLAWHPRHDADPAHAWLRGVVRELLAEWPDEGVLGEGVLGEGVAQPPG